MHFIYPEEQEMDERNAIRHGRHFDKVEASGDAGSGYEKLVTVAMIFV